jgi:hypothetical protein
MAINTPAPTAAYVANLGQHAVDFRDALQRLLTDATYLNEQGGATFLQSLGLDSGDASTIASTIGAITPDNEVVQQVQAFITSTVFLWGGN